MCIHPKWGYSNETETCDCGIRQTMQHLLVCPMMNTACSTHDVATANGIAIGCVRHWAGMIWLKCDWWKDKNDDDSSPFHVQRAPNSRLPFRRCLYPGLFSPKPFPIFPLVDACLDNTFPFLDITAFDCPSATLLAASSTMLPLPQCTQNY